VITPTIGRMVWYTPNSWDLTQAVRKDEQPFHAMVVYVWNDRLVNLVVYDHNGMFFTKTSVKLLQDDAMPNEGEPYAQWMPYQKGQAAKYEALEKEKANA